MMETNGFEKMNIQWFPGHMTKAQRMIEDNVKLVDAVCEIIDARIPRAATRILTASPRGSPGSLSSTASTLPTPC